MCLPCFGPGIPDDPVQQFNMGERLHRGKTKGKGQSTHTTKITPKNLHDAIRLYTLSANQGYLKAQMALAECYSQGDGVERDMSKSFELLMRAAEQGHAEAQKRVGDCYRTGQGVKQDMEQALRFYARAEKQGCEEAGGHLRDYYLESKMGDKKYPEEVGGWLDKAIQQGHTKILTELRLLAFREANAHAMNALRLISDQGNADAMYQLGRCLNYGKGVERDEAQAVEWYAKAAQKGHKDAMHALYCLAYDDFSNVKAFDALHSVAAEGHSDAQYFVSLCYKHACCVKRDASKEVEWSFKAAQKGKKDAIKSLFDNVSFYSPYGESLPNALRTLAEQGDNADAMYSWGMCNLKGMGSLVEQDHKQAVEWFKKAANHVEGSADAEYQLGECFEDGKGVEQNKKQAVEWYTKAAQKGHKDAITKLGRLAEKEEGTHEDARKALRSVADQGHAEAEFLVGKCYHDGEGVEKDYKQAVEWLTKAGEKAHRGAMRELCYFGSLGMDGVDAIAFLAEQGHEFAMFKMGELYRDGDWALVNIDLKQAAMWFTKALQRGYKDALESLQNVLKESKEVDGLHLLAEKGDAQAQFDLGDRARLMKGIAFNYDMVMKLFAKAAEQGHLGGLSRIADFKANSGAVETLRSLSDQGNADAQFNLGRCYKEGNGVESDEDQAIEWLTKAAKQGHEEAQTMLHHYASPPIQNSRALNSLLSLSDYANAESMILLGECFHNGYGADLDMKRAIEWYSKAAQQGHSRAMDTLCFLASFEENPDAFGAVLHFAGQGNMRAMRCAGHCYITGNVVEMDKKQGEEWILKAAKQGHMESLQDIFERRLNLDALTTLRSLADQGNASAIHFLATAYSEGKIVGRNIKQAVDLFTHAFQSGCEDSIESLYDIAFNMSRVDGVDALRLLADQGHIKAMLYLANCYRYGKGMDHAEEEQAEKLFTKLTEVVMSG